MRDVDISVDDVSQLRQALGRVAGNLSTNTGVKSPSPGSHSARGSVDDGSALTEDDVRLVFAGKDLHEGQPLRQYGIGRESTVHALGRLRGGAQLGKVVKGRSQVRCSKYRTRGRRVFVRGGSWSVYVMPLISVFFVVGDHSERCGS